MEMLTAMFQNKWRKIVVIIAILLVVHILAYFLNLLFPNCLVLLITAILLVIIPCLFMRLVSVKVKFIILALSFICASANWLLVSYESYYNGVKTNLVNEANVLYETRVKILESSTDENRKKELLEDIYSRSYSQITVKKNGNPFVFVESKRSRDEYVLKPIIDTQHILINTDDFTFKHEYANKPKLPLGIIRAWTFSVIPDLNFDNKDYLNKKLYNRSITFWWVFIILSYSGLIVTFQLKQKDNDTEARLKTIKERNEAVEEKIKAIEQMQWIEENISNIHKHTFAQIMRDIKDSTTTKAKTVLQELLVNWNNKKQFVDDYENLYEILDKTGHSIKHDYRSKWTDENEFYAKNKTGIIINCQKCGADIEINQKLLSPYIEDIRPYIDEIINDLNDIPRLLDVRVKKASISEIIDKLNEIDFINGSKRKEKGINFNYIIINSELINGDKYCLINLERIKSIVYNLITNSVTAINNQKKIYRKEHKLYEGKILLKVNVVEVSKKKYLYFSCEDNGGGFPEPDKIYKQEIISSRRNADGSERKGEGTMYIKFFVELYGGKIEGSNYDIGEGLIGAKTEIYFPIIY